MIVMMKDHWKIDRRVPIAVILALVMQAAGALVWATQLEARVGEVEQKAIGNSNLNEKFARLDERLDNLKQDTSIMRRQLDRLIER